MLRRWDSGKVLTMAIGVGRSQNGGSVCGWLRWAIALSLIGGAGVAVQLSVVVAFERGGKLLEELEDLGGRLVGQTRHTSGRSLGCIMVLSALCAEVWIGMSLCARCVLGQPARSAPAAQGPEPHPGRKPMPAETAAQRRHRRARCMPPIEHARLCCGDRERTAGHAVRTRSGFNVCGIGRVHPRHGFGRGGCHCDSDAGGCGTVMRHYLCLACTPRALAGRVPTGAAVAALVASASAAQRLASADQRTVPRAVPVAAVAAAADPHLHATATAVVKSMRLFEHCPARSTQDWTMPCIAAVKATRRCPLQAPQC